MIATDEFSGEYGMLPPVTSNCHLNVPPANDGASTRALVTNSVTLPLSHFQLVPSSVTAEILNGVTGVCGVLLLDWLEEPVESVVDALWTYDALLSADGNVVPPGPLARNSRCELLIEPMILIATMATTAINTKNAPLRSRRSSRIDFNESMLGNYTTDTPVWLEFWVKVLRYEPAPHRSAGPSSTGVPERESDPDGPQAVADHHEVACIEAFEGFERQGAQRDLVAADAQDLDAEVERSVLVEPVVVTQVQDGVTSGTTQPCGATLPQGEEADGWFGGSPVDRQVLFVALGHQAKGQVLRFGGDVADQLGAVLLVLALPASQGVAEHAADDADGKCVGELVKLTEQLIGCRIATAVHVGHLSRYVCQTPFTGATGSFGHLLLDGRTLLFYHKCNVQSTI